MDQQPFTPWVPKLAAAGSYSAPDDAVVHPYVIPPGWEVVEILTGGRVFFACGGKRREFGRGTIFWHRAGGHTIFETTPDAPYRCLALQFEVEDDHPARPPEGRIGSWKKPELLDSFCTEVLELFAATRENHPALGIYVYGMLLRQYLSPNAAGASDKAAYPVPLARALRLLSNEAERSWDGNRLCRAAGISAPQLNRLFRQHLGQSPFRYYQAQLMARARLLLLADDRPIKEIAAECGFDAIEVFYRNFTRISGMPPGAYRQRYRAYRFN